MTFIRLHHDLNPVQNFLHKASNTAVWIYSKTEISYFI